MSIDSCPMEGGYTFLVGEGEVEGRVGGVESGYCGEFSALSESVQG
jgi:hypothetical protein